MIHWYSDVSHGNTMIHITECLPYLNTIVCTWYLIGINERVIIGPIMVERVQYVGIIIVLWCLILCLFLSLNAASASTEISPIILIQIISGHENNPILLLRNVRAKSRDCFYSYYES